MSKILVIDDEIETCKMLKELFGLMTKSEVIVSNSTNEYLKLIQQIKFDIICIDYIMPDLLGDEVVQYIRTTENPNKNTKIVMITAHEDAELQKSISKLGSIAIISKPIIVDQLARQIQNLNPQAGV